MSISFIQPNSSDVREISAQIAQLTAIESARAAHEGATIPSVYWNEVKTVAGGGMASSRYSVGGQFVDTYTDPDANSTTTYSNPWDIMDFRDVTKNDGTTTPAIIIGTHYTGIANITFCGWQAFIYSETGLPANTYHFTAGSSWGSNGLVADTSYQFTLTQALPAKGHIVGVKRWPDVALATWTFETYSSYSSTTAIETVSVTTGSDGFNLGTANLNVPSDELTVSINSVSYTYRFNGIQQAGYGNNRWKHSAVRQYLNSDAAAGEWWTPQTVFDRAPDYASTKAGWLAGCSNEFKSVLTPVLVKTAIPSAQATAEGVTFDETYDKVFLPSLEEHYISKQIAGEGDAWDYWKLINGTNTVWPTGVATDALKMYSITNHATATNRWLRSANRGYGNTAWGVNTSGAVYYGSAAYYAFALAPACAIC